MRKRPGAAPNRSDRWMLTYSDLMNLLLILFIILYCSSRVDLQKANQVASSIKKGFNTTEIRAGTTPAFQTSHPTASGQAGVSGGETGESYEKLYEAISALIRQQNLQGEITVNVAQKGVIITLRDTVLFAPGSAVLDASARALLGPVGDILKQVDFSQIVVEGFTDSDPIHTAQFQDNRDLSSMRANNVARLLQQRGIAPQKLSALGYGEFRPVAPNDTAANKAKNRRVVITVLKPDLTADAVIEAGKLESQMNAAGSSGNAPASPAGAASASAGSSGAAKGSGR